MSVSPWIAKLDELAAAINASKLLLVEQDRQLNYGEFFTRVNQTSSFIRDLGLNLDDRVIISTRDTVSLMFVFFACLRSGVIGKKHYFSLVRDRAYAYPWTLQ